MSERVIRLWVPVSIAVLAAGAALLIGILTARGNSHDRRPEARQASRAPLSQAESHETDGRPQPLPPGSTVPPETPATSVAVPAAAGTAEPEMPALDENEIDAAVYAAQADRICRAMDAVMQTWPRYATVRDALHEELARRFDLERVAVDQLAQMALALREQFWQAGGNFSPSAYRDGYTARLLLEIAHQRDPRNLTITDELVETMQAVEVSWAWVQKGETASKVRNDELARALRSLRLAQFEQTKQEVAQGRRPMWEDFVRANDLPLLLGKLGEFETARQVVEWEMEQAERGGWTAYLDPLERSLDVLNQGDVLEFNIYWARHSSYPEEYKYARRLPSFRGPRPQQRGVTPLHQLSAHPTWGPERNDEDSP